MDKTALTNQTTDAVSADRFRELQKPSPDRKPEYLRQAGLHVKLLEHGVHVTRGASVLQSHEARN